MNSEMNIISIPFATPQTGPCPLKQTRCLKVLAQAEMQMMPTVKDPLKLRVDTPGIGLRRITNPFGFIELVD
jgi:hypothetical protein